MIQMNDEILLNEFNKPYFKKLDLKLAKLREENIVYPKEEDVFNAFKYTKIEDVKVVILGQDPYHGKNQAHGLSFSSLDTKTPKSLINIKKELYSDLGIEISPNNNMTNWAKQGVLLLNTVLTVNEGKPNSHQNIGWETFTLNIFKEITKLDKPIVFILWGNHAISYKKYITNNKHLVIESSHPSPFSARISFFGSKPFSKTNEYLIKNNLSPIDFNL